jgi:hypothetical protein
VSSSFGERVQGEGGIGSLDDRPPERRALLEGVEIERLVAEEDVLGAARRRQPGGGVLARLLAHLGLPSVHPRSPVDAPGDLPHQEDDERDAERERRPAAGSG